MTDELMKEMETIAENAAKEASREAFKEALKAHEKWKENHPRPTKKKYESQKEAKKRYQEKSKRYYLECSPSETDIIAKLEAERDKEGYVRYIKRLIREDIAKSK